MYVYLLRNKVNDKLYVGKTVSNNLNRYLSVKRWAARHRRDVGMPVVKAMAKYGNGSFTTQILATADSDEQLCALERLWIIALDARNPAVGYNLCAGGGVGRLGVRTSEETKRRIGMANRGRKPVGYVRTAEHREQLSQRMRGNRRGRKITPEIAARWRAAETPEQGAQRGAAIKAAWDRRKLAQTG